MTLERRGQETQKGALLLEQRGYAEVRKGRGGHTVQTYHLTQDFSGRFRQATGGVYTCTPSDALLNQIIVQKGPSREDELNAMRSAIRHYLIELELHRFLYGPPPDD